MGHEISGVPVASVKAEHSSGPLLTRKTVWEQMLMLNKSRSGNFTLSLVSMVVLMVWPAALLY